jgi:chemotaxis family two-component system response regulator Rcp1
MIDILLVEDNRVDAELFTRAFSEAHRCAITIEVVTNGEEALRFLRELEIKPRLVLLDLNLPKMSGFEVLQELRQDPDPMLSVLPVIILTNSRSSQDVARAYGYHANAFVRKPIGFPAIVRVARQLGKFWLKCAMLPSPDLNAQPPSLPPPSPPPSSENPS